ETLLDRHSDSPLRPLALYRLGWAYRSTGAQGFPRMSGDDAFDALERDYPGSSLARLAAEARSVPWKSKTTAATYSIIPGLGQIYEGRFENGAIRLGIGVTSAAAVLVPLGIALHRGHDLEWNHDWPLLLTGTLGAIVVSIDYTTSYQDAVQ